MSDNMDKKTMLKKINHLQCLNSLKRKDRLAVVDICSDDCILAVCEACYNFLKDIIPLKYYQKYRLKSKSMPISATTSRPSMSRPRTTWSTCCASSTSWAAIVFPLICVCRSWACGYAPRYHHYFSASLPKQI